jgi:Na+/phosphate symporter
MKQAIADLSEMIRKIEEVLKLCQHAFNKHKLADVKKAEALAQEVHKLEGVLTPIFLEKLKTVNDAKSYVSLPGHFRRISHNLEEILMAISQKIRDRVLFSDKGVDEINVLLNETATLLHNIADLIITRNSIIAKEVSRISDSILEKAIDYTTLHEDRLIQGMCLPLSSSIYVHMLDAIRGIAWHGKEIAEHFAD